MFRVLWFLVIISSSVMAVAKPDWLVVVPKQLLVPEEIQLKWTEDFFQSDEIWVIDSRVELFEYITQQVGKEGFTIGNQSWLTMQFDLTEIPAKLKTSIFGLYDPIDLTVGGYVFPSEALKHNLGINTLRAIYQYLSLSGRGLPSIEARNETEFYKLLESLNLSSAERAKVNQLRFTHSGRVKSPIRVNLWSHLPLWYRRKIVKIYATFDDINKMSFELKVEIKADSGLAGIAAHLASREVSREKILNQLKEHLVRSNGQVIQLPIEQFLPEFMRATIFKFDLCGGSNNINCALNVQLGRDAKANYVDEDLLESKLENYFFPIDLKGLPQLGDLVVYYHSSGEVAHAAAYMFEDFVFTKKHSSRFYPTVYQHKTQIEQIYFPSDNYTSQVFRIREDVDLSQFYFPDPPPVKIFKSDLCKSGLLAEE